MSRPPSIPEVAPESPWVVLKFGGTSVASLERWESIAKVIRDRLESGLRPLLVCSAVSQVSNDLEAALATALDGEVPTEMIDVLRDRHERLAAELGCELPKEAAEQIDQLEVHLTAVAATHEASPRLRAEILATGELVSTRLAVAWLSKQGLPSAWLDARELLKADETAPPDPHRQYLSATCSIETDASIDHELRRRSEPVLVTQGFLAGAPDGGTALLGRGGSDTSAAYFGQLLGAKKIEIWTDVAGLYSADPRIVPNAQVLRRVGYDEVLELATRGAKVLHPGCLLPARASRIPIEVRCTGDPSSPGTLIHDEYRVEEPASLAIATRRNMAVITMDVESSWQQVGVLAELTACFARNGLSIDSITSSQTRVTISLDPAANQLVPEILDPLVEELRTYAEPRVVAPVASVSVVGTHLQRVLHGLPSLLHELESREVYLIAHAANDHSLTFVVNESEANDIVRSLHADLVDSDHGIPDEVASVTRNDREEDASVEP